jgi:hypothetical protein
VQSGFPSGIAQEKVRNLRQQGRRGNPAAFLFTGHGDVGIHGSKRGRAFLSVKP